MRNLKVWQKLALMGIVFMIPFAGVTYKMTSSINALGVDFARLEVSGLEYYAPVAMLMKELQLHRDIANGLLSGDASLSDKLVRKRADVENAIKTLDDVDARLNRALHTTERWTPVRAAALDLLKSTPNFSDRKSVV